MPIVQSVLINKHHYTLDEAINILLNYGLTLKKVDETSNYYRFRQVEPKKLKNQGYTKVKTNKINEYIYFITYYK